MKEYKKVIIIRKIIILLLTLNFLFALDYALEDVNDTSPTYGELVGPSYFQDQGRLISINYFGWETWGSWRPLFAQLCDLSNTNAWDTDKAVLIGVGVASGGDTGLNGMIDQEGVNAPWVQDPEKVVWDDFLGENAPRRQIVLLDHNLEKRFQEHYGGPLDNQEEAELLLAIQNLIDEAFALLGDMNGDENLNVLDVIILVNMALGSIDIDLIGDINSDGGINILDVVLLVNIILND